MAKMTKIGQFWHCGDCDYSTLKKSNIKTHIEVTCVKRKKEFLAQICIIERWKLQTMSGRQDFLKCV